MSITSTLHVEDSGATLMFPDALRRAKADFLEMPGLRVTVHQAMRLWAFDAELCGAVLRELVDARFLVCSRNAVFLRAE